MTYLKYKIILLHKINFLNAVLLNFASIKIKRLICAVLASNRMFFAFPLKLTQPILIPNSYSSTPI